jgi:hypothetical protein
VRRFSSEQIDGAVIRATSASVVGGPLRWTFDSATGRHLWAVHIDFGVTANGALVESPCGDRFQFEALRTLKRLTEARDAPCTSKTVPAKACYGTVQIQIQLAVPPAAEIICQKLLFGEPNQEARERLNADSLSDFIQQASPGLKALGALKSHAGMSWQPDPMQKGQLHLQEHGTNVLIWCYPGSAIRMRQTLQRWRSELAASPPLLVFNKAVGAYPMPHETSERRRDVGDAPSSKRRSVDEPTHTAQIVTCNLDDIEACFDTEIAADLATAIDTQLANAVAAFSGGGRSHD